MSSFCSECGSKLSLVRRISGRSLCPACTSEVAKRRIDAEQEYKAMLAQMVRSTTSVAEIERQLPAVAGRAALSTDKTSALHLQFFRTLVEDALADDCLTEDEESHMFEIGRVLSIEQDTFDTQCKDLKLRLYVARVNDGRIPVLEKPNIMMKKEEVAHMSAEAEILKEVAVREYQGGYSGFSFRVMKGVRFHTGSTRGRSVVVGTRIETADRGALTVTSQRVVFAGQRQSLEIAYAKLLNMNVFNDGIQFHISNRKTAPVFRLQEGMGNVIAATINATCQ